MTKIEWCDETINPLGWGCYGPGGTAERPKPCLYCYARRASRGPWAAQRGCEKCAAFIPHWHPEMLEKPRGWTKPRRIFVQSMGDLFHPETPREHIEAVLDVARECPRHTFLLLTKNPQRYLEFSFPLNCWLGATATSQRSWARAIVSLAETNPGGQRPIVFISAEPLLAEIEPLEIDLIDWLIIGADSSPGAKKPKAKWGADFIRAARQANVPVFVKDNWPWSTIPGLTQEFPSGIQESQTEGQLTIEEVAGV